jgi:hypothetical protein
MFYRVLALLPLLLACRQEEAAVPEPSPPVAAGTLDAPRQQSENLRGTGALDSMDDTGPYEDPLPPASEGSPYNQSYKNEAAPASKD